MRWYLKSVKKMRMEIVQICPFYEKQRNERMKDKYKFNFQFDPIEFSMQ